MKKVRVNSYKLKVRNVIPFILFTLVIVGNLFLITSLSHAITINGSNEITTNGSASYTASGCNGTVTWGVTNPGASITQSGVLTTINACGTVLIAARCYADGVIATKSVRVSDGGQWVQIECNGAWPYGAVSPQSVLTGFDGSELYGARCDGGWEPGIFDWVYKIIDGIKYSVRTNGVSGGKATVCCCTDLLPYSVFTFLPGTPLNCSSGHSTAGVQWRRKEEWRCPSSSCPYNIAPEAQETCGDLKDNNCNGQVDEGCGKILSYVSGNGQEDYICKTLQNPFVVSVSGASQGGVGINWLVTNSPSGSSASISQSVTTIEGTETLSSAYLKLGSLPGSYTTEARCAECTSGSPQKFTANAKCPEVPKYYQGDYKKPYDNWCYVNNNKKNRATCQRDDKGNLKTGYTQFSISDIGCTLTSASMVMKWYEYELGGKLIDPVSLNGLMNDTDEGYINGGFNFDKVKDVTSPDLLAYKRDIKKGEKVVPKSELDGYLEKCIPVIVMVSNKTSGHYHFVVVTKKIGDDYVINDPGYKVKPRTSLSDPAYGGDIYAFRVLYNRKGACEQ